MHTVTMYRRSTNQKLWGWGQQSTTEQVLQVILMLLQFKNPFGLVRAALLSPSCLFKSPQELLGFTRSKPIRLDCEG